MRAAAAPAYAPPRPHRSRPRSSLTSLRKTIARRLTEAWQAPAFQISMSARQPRAELHARLREQGRERDGHPSRNSQRSRSFDIAR